MVAHNYASTANKPTLTAAVASNATSLTVNAFTGWPAAPAWAEIARGTSSAEIVEITAISGTTLTVNRGMDGTLASAHSTGDLVELIVPALHFNNEEVHTNSAGSVHGITSTVVGTTDIQSLTQKMYQGGHKSVFSDVNPSGLAVSYESIADTNAAREGYAHRNTAGDINRRGFYLEQSGTARGEWFNDGTIKFTPNSAAARAGLEVNSVAANVASQVTNASSSNAVAFKVMGDGTTTSLSDIAAQNGSVTSKNFGAGQFGATSSVTVNNVVGQQSLRQPWHTLVANVYNINTQVPQGAYPNGATWSTTFIQKEDGWANVRAYVGGYAMNGVSGGTEIANGRVNLDLYNQAGTTIIENPGWQFRYDFVNDNVRGITGQGIIPIEELFTTRLTAGTTYTLKFILNRSSALAWVLDTMRVFVTPVVRNA